MNTLKTIIFLSVSYTEAMLNTMTDDDLLSVRNLVAENLGVARIKGFKDHDQAVSATWKALEKFDSTQDDQLANNESKPAKAKKEAAPKEPKEPRHVKGAEPSHVKRPTRGMFRKIEKIKEPDRVKERWGNYKDGMTVLETIEGDNMTPLDIYWYADQGFVKLIDPTEEEFQAGVAAWYKREGLTNPAEAKKKAKEEAAAKAEEAKAKKEAEAAAKAEAKAKKDAEKAELKAKADADKKAKAAADAAKKTS